MSETKPKKKSSVTYKQSTTDVYLKKVIYERIKMRGNIPYHDIWYFRAQDFPCGSCHSSADVAFLIRNGKVFFTCTNCGITYKIAPIDHEGRKLAVELQEPKQVSMAEAKAICERIGQKVPILLSRETRREPRREEVEKELAEEFGEQ